MSRFALEVKHLSAVYETNAVLWQVNVAVPSGEIIGILGPNGSGKSTFLKAITGLITPFSGSVSYFGKPYRAVRRKVAYVPQRSLIDFDFPVTVYDVVSMGCFARKGLFGRIDKEDKRVIEQALSDLGLLLFADRQIKELSGGQQQKTFLARALVQQADIYLMDEPFAGIDLASETAIMDMLRALKAQGKTIILVHHDLHSVRAYFDRVILLNTSLVAEGPVDLVFTRENLMSAYGHHFSLFETIGS